jgi:hypothetical protein
MAGTPDRGVFEEEIIATAGKPFTNTSHAAGPIRTQYAIDILVREWYHHPRGHFDFDFDFDGH